MTGNCNLIEDSLISYITNFIVPTPVMLSINRFPSSLNFSQLNLLEKMVEIYYSASYFLRLVAQFMLFSLVVKKIRGNPLFPSISMLLIHCVSTTTLGVVSVKVF